MTEVRYNGDLTGWCGISGLGNLMEYGKSTKTLYIDGTKIEGDLVIPEGVTSISGYAFYYCSILTSITIPNSVTQIDYMAFCNSSGLTDIHYNGNLTGWLNISGLDNLMAYVSTKTLYIDGTKIEGDLVIPEGVTSIGSYAFYNCSILTSITIPNSVTQIGDSAFYNCSILRSIRFQGTKTEWAAITKGSSWNYYAGDYKVYCTNGMLSRSES